MRYFEVVKDDYRKNSNVEIKLPTRGSKNSAGYDFYSPIDAVIQPNEMVMIWTDVKASMYYDNALLIIPRSSMGKHPIMISNTVGLIDSDYYGNESTDGNIGFRLFNLGTTPYEINAGDRIGQGIFIKYGTIKDDNTTTERKGGFGSTGNN
jgi:dUTP pyrophosphatase